MPKMKSNRAAARRFSFTASGLVKRAKAGARHILTKKSSKRKRRLAQNGVLERLRAQGFTVKTPGEL